MLINIRKDLPFRVCGFANNNLIFTKYCETKDEAILYFNHCCAATSSDIYRYEIWNDSNSTLLFSTGE